MKEIIYLKGDATEPVGTGHRIIAHICNNLGGWGRGFTRSLSKKWVTPEEIYREADELELGDVLAIRVEPDIEVFNMIAQSGYKCQTNPVAIRYRALEKCFKDMLEYIILNWPEKENVSIHMPRIGCGLAGGSWDKIEPIIKKHFSENDIQVYIYDLK